MAARTSAQLQAIIIAALGGQLDQAAAERLHAFGPEAVGIAMLAASKHIAEQDERLSKQGTMIARLQGAAQPAPSTPSGMIPTYIKTNVSKRHKKPSARLGHPGATNRPSGGPLRKRRAGCCATACGCAGARTSCPANIRAGLTG